MAPFIITPGGGGSGDQVLIQSDSNTTNAKMTARVYPNSHLELKYGYEGEDEANMTKWIDLPLPVPAWLIFLLGFLSIFLGMTAPAVAQNATNGLYTIFPAGIESPNYQGDADALMLADPGVNYDEGDGSLDGHRQGIDDVLGTLGVITYDTPATSLYAGQDRMIGENGNGPGGPISIVVTGAADVVIDKLITDDLHRSQVDAGDLIFRVYSADFEFDPVLGPTGTMLYEFIDDEDTQDLWETEQIPVIYDFEPDFSIITGQKFFLYWNFSEIVAPTWEAPSTSVIYNNKSDIYESNPYLNLQHGVTNYPGGVADSSVPGTTLNAMWVRAAPEDPTETITELKQSASLRIDVDDNGGLSLERLSQPLRATTDFGSQSVQIINGGTWGSQSIGDVTTSREAFGMDFQFTAVSAHTLIGFQLGLDSTIRGQDWTYGIQNQDRSITHASGSLDDAGGTGDGMISFIFDAPVPVEIGQEYILFIETDTAQPIEFLINSGGTASYTDGILTYDGWRRRLGVWSLRSHLPQMYVLLEGGDMENTTIIESGNGISFSSAAGVTTISQGPLTDTVWDDVRLGVGAFDFAGVTDPSLVNYQPTGAGTTFKLYEFAKNTEIFAEIQLPHTYAPGTDLSPHVHWTPAGRGVTEGTATVGWKIDYSIAGIGETWPASSTIDLSDATESTDDQHLLAGGADIPGTGIEESDVILLRVYRSDTGADDTWTGTGTGNLPLLVSVDIHMQINKLGSEDEIP